MMRFSQVSLGSKMVVHVDFIRNYELATKGAKAVMIFQNPSCFDFLSADLIQHPPPLDAILYASRFCEQEKNTPANYNIRIFQFQITLVAYLLELIRFLYNVDSRTFLAHKRVEELLLYQLKSPRCKILVGLFYKSPDTQHVSIWQVNGRYSTHPVPSEKR